MICGESARLYTVPDMKKYISSAMFVLAALLWGLAFTAQKNAGALPAFTVGASRNIIATVFLLLVIPLLDKVQKNGRRLITKTRPLDFTKQEIIGGIVCGIVLTAASAFQQVGISGDTDAGKAAFITALYVVIVPIIYRLIGKHSPLNVWVSVGIAVIGFYLLCIKEDFSILPSDGLVLICAFVFALHIMAIDHYSPKCDGVRMSCIQFFVSFILNTVLALIFESPIDFGLIVACLPSILYLGICSSGIAYTLQIVGQRDANPAVACVILSLESVFGVIGGAVVLGETMSPKEYVGCVIVFIAVVLSQLDFKAILAKTKNNGENANNDLQKQANNVNSTIESDANAAPDEVNN